jgi:hypothetical protein
VDITATQARAKGAAPSANHEGGQTGATATKTPSALPPPTVDGLDRMYHQPAKIHAIATMQLVERANSHTQLLAQFELGSIDRGLLRSPLQL